MNTVFVVSGWQVFGCISFMTIAATLVAFWARLSGASAQAPGPDYMRRHGGAARRHAVTETIAFAFDGAPAINFEIMFVLDNEFAVREVVSVSESKRRHLQLVVEDACALASIALQHGASIGHLARSLDGLRDGEAAPVTPLGAIARAGVALEKDIAGGRP